MDLSLLLPNLLYGVTIGSALILIASGLSLTFGVMGVLNFAHGGLCMLGAYFGYTFVQVTGNFWLAMILAPLVVAGISVLMEAFTIRPLYGLNPLFQLLLTVGLSMVIANAVLLIWGGDSLSILLPSYFKGSFSLFGLDYPRFRLVRPAFQRIAGVRSVDHPETDKMGHRHPGRDARPRNGKRLRHQYLSGSLRSFLPSEPALAAVAGVVIGSMRAINPEMDFELADQRPPGGRHRGHGLFSRGGGGFPPPGRDRRVRGAVFYRSGQVYGLGFDGAGPPFPARRPAEGGLKWRRRIASLIVLIVLLALPLGADVLYSGFYVTLLTRCFIFAVVVVGFDLLAGYTGMVSYGHALFFGTGAYLTGMILKHWSPWFWPPSCPDDPRQRRRRVYRRFFIHPHPAHLFCFSDVRLCPVLFRHRQLPGTSSALRTASPAFPNR